MYLRPTEMYFGSTEGVFRLYPARQFPSVCGTFNSLHRPWYNNAISGPKEIVLVLDTSLLDQPLALMKQAATLFIQTLSENDRVAIVTSAGDSDDLMVTASEDNKRKLTDLINKINTTDKPNLSGAFHSVFGIIDRTKQKSGFNDSCHTVIVLFTNGASATQDASNTYAVEQDIDTSCES